MSNSHPNGSLNVLFFGCCCCHHSSTAGLPYLVEHTAMLWPVYNGVPLARTPISILYRILKDHKIKARINENSIENGEWSLDGLNAHIRCTQQIYCCGTWYFGKYVFLGIPTRPYSFSSVFHSNVSFFRSLSCCLVHARCCLTLAFQTIHSQPRVSRWKTARLIIIVKIGVSIVSKHKNQKQKRIISKIKSSKRKERIHMNIERAEAWTTF